MLLNSLKCLDKAMIKYELVTIGLFGYCLLVRSTIMNAPLEHNLIYYAFPRRRWAFLSVFSTNVPGPTA